MRNAVMGAATGSTPLMTGEVRRLIGSALESQTELSRPSSRATAEVHSGSADAVSTSGFTPTTYPGPRFSTHAEDGQRPEEAREVRGGDVGDELVRRHEPGMVQSGFALRADAGSHEDHRGRDHRGVGGEVV